MKDFASISKRWAIFVPTRGRANYIKDNKGVWRYYPCHHPKVNLMVRKSEAQDYIDAGVSSMAIHNVPDDYDIAQKRQAIFDKAIEMNLEYLFIIDDDVILDHRRTDVPTKFTANYYEPRKNFELIETCLRICGQQFPLVHPRIRFHADAARYRYEKNSPAIRFVCYHVPTLVEYDIRMDGMGTTFMSDRYVQHTLLSLGYSSIALGNFVVGDYGTGKKGGCEITRTPEKHGEAAKALSRLFPDNVKLKIKTNGLWATPRADCTQYLKKYLNQGELQYVPKEEMEREWSNE